MSSSLSHSILYSQNYLKDPSIVAMLLEKSSLGSEDRVYEIGPGKGIITGQLARRCKHVYAIEKDACLAARLTQNFAGAPNVTIYTGDFLHSPLPCGSYKVFANIPFNITSEIVARLTTSGHPPVDSYLVMQKEAANTYLGKPHESLRSVLLEPWFEMEILHHFRRSDFIPQPRVDVVMLRLRKRGPPLVADSNRQCFRDFVVYIFTAWRPSLKKTLRGVFNRRQLNHIQRELHIDLDATPTETPFERWQLLFAYFLEVGSPAALEKISGSETRLSRQQRRLQKVHHFTGQRRSNTPN